MPANLSIKNVPDEVLSGLRSRAVSHRRSLNAEVLDILKQAAKGQAPVSIDGLLEQAERPKAALDETASRVLAAHDAEHEKTAQRFQDLLGGSVSDETDEASGEER